MDLFLALSVWPPSSSRQSLPTLVPWLDQSSCTTLEVSSKGSEEYSLDSWTMSTTPGGSSGYHICSGLMKSTLVCNFSEFCSSRFLEGVANAAAAASMLGILMQLFPSRESSITAWTEMCLGLGYMLGTQLMSKSSLYFYPSICGFHTGPSIGSLFYSVGGFGLPFFVVGTLGIILAVALLVKLLFKVFSLHTAFSHQNIVGASPKSGETKNVEREDAPEQERWGWQWESWRWDKRDSP